MWKKTFDHVYNVLTFGLLNKNCEFCIIFKKYITNKTISFFYFKYSLSCKNRNYAIRYIGKTKRQWVLDWNWIWFRNDFHYFLAIEVLIFTKKMYEVENKNSTEKIITYDKIIWEWQFQWWIRMVCCTYIHLK